VPYFQVAQPPLRDLIYKQLVDLIVTGQLKPGSRLVESELANVLGTSRVPVREALLELGKEGWVDLRARQGAWVHEPQESEIEDVFAVRGALEAESARLAAIHRTDAHIASMRAIVERGTALAKAGDHDGVAKANTEFHREVTRASGNSLLAELATSLEYRVRWYFHQVAAVRGAASWDEHAKIVDMIADSDAAGAAAMIRDHVNLTRAMLHRSDT
jgi:DNA-binding GntR family transcriptional regulator